MYKSIIRKEILRLRNNLKSEEKNSLDKKIFNSLIESNIYKESKKIFIYVSYNNEVDTKEIIKHSFENNKIIYVPKINIEDKTMNAVKIHSLNELYVNKYGILEPNIVDKNDVGLEFDFIIMPGMVFDKAGNRIGYGGGYYDKYLSSLSYKVDKVALAYNFQIVDNIKTEEHDIKVDYIITDNEIMYI